MSPRLCAFQHKMLSLWPSVEGRAVQHPKPLGVSEGLSPSLSPSATPPPGDLALLASLCSGIPTVPGKVTLQKDAQNLIGISIGGGAQYCPCLYIVQVLGALGPGVRSSKGRATSLLGHHAGRFLPLLCGAGSFLFLRSDLLGETFLTSPHPVGPPFSSSIISVSSLPSQHLSLSWWSST